MADEAPKPNWRPEWRDPKPKGGTGRRIPPAPVAEIGPCPDPTGPLAQQQLYAAAFKRTWAILESPETTPQDVVSILSVARLGARVGTDKVVAKGKKLRASTIMPTAQPLEPAS